MLKKANELTPPPPQVETELVIEKTFQRVMENAEPLALGGGFYYRNTVISTIVILSFVQFVFFLYMKKLSAPPPPESCHAS